MSRDGGGAYRAIDRQGWKLNLAAPDEMIDPLAAIAIEAARGSTGNRIRLSRHAETWLARLGDTDFFIKIIYPFRGFGRIKRLFRDTPAAHVAGITADLARDGFEVAAPMLWGTEISSGREVIVTERARGITLPRFLRENGTDMNRKRAMLSGLGAEIARLHRLGYLHGDLTPFNVLVSTENRGRFIFIDHERTRKTWLARFQRARLRNLVQLGHFTLPNLSRTDRLRVWREYVGKRDARGELNRLNGMIKRRLERNISRRVGDNHRIVAHSRMRET